MMHSEGDSVAYCDGPDTDPGWYVILMDDETGEYKETLGPFESKEEAKKEETKYWHARSS